MLPIDLRVLGVGSARPRDGSPTSAVHVASGGSRVLVDCGEGTQVQLDRHGLSLGRLAAVCVTHLHGDHVYGLPGLLASMALEGRTRPLTVVGPPGLPAFLAAVAAVTDAHDPGFEVRHVTADDDEPRRDVLVLPDLAVHTVPLRHRVRCVGFCVGARERGRHLRPGVVERYGIPYTEIPALRRGADFAPADGPPVANADLTTPPDPPRSVAYLTDTAPLDRWPGAWPPPTVLLHDATFAPEDRALATETGHSTVTQAAAFAKAAGADRLLLTHLSVRYGNRAALLTQAREVFANADWAVAGESVVL